MTEIDELLNQLPVALEGVGLIVLVFVVAVWMIFPLKKETSVVNKSPDRDGGE